MGEVTTNPFLIRKSGATKLEDRSFIDLSFNGVAVSLLGLTVTYDLNVNLNFGPEFLNITSLINHRDGILYWGTNVHSFKISKTLSTDCMTSLQYRKAKALFVPGKVGRLILALRPYCYLYVVLSEVPLVLFTPFDCITTINGTNYNDVVYKGSITVLFQALLQHWFGQLGLTFNDYMYSDGNLPWLLLSGLLPSSTATFLQNSAKTTSSRSFTAYNAGTADSSANLSFTVKCVDRSSDNKFGPDYNKTVTNVDTFLSQKHLIKVSGLNNTYTLTINPIRALSDISYAINNCQDIGEGYYKDSVKQNFITLLKDNLDSNSGWKSIILKLAKNSTEASNLITLLKCLARDATYVFEINTINHLMLVWISYVDPETNEESTTAIVENIEGVTNGEYIFIEPGGGLGDINKTQFTIVTQDLLAASYSNINLYFLNEYV